MQSKPRVSSATPPRMQRRSSFTLLARLRGFVHSLQEHPIIPLEARRLKRSRSKTPQASEDHDASSERRPRRLKPQPPSGNVVNSTPAIATRNEEPAPSNGTPPARQRNEVGRPMFSLVYDLQLSMPQRGTSAKLAMRHASTSQRRATPPSICNASSQSLEVMALPECVRGSGQSFAC